MSFMDRARERAYAAGFATPSADDRLAELEREVAALRETVGELQGGLRGANDWIAEHSDWINASRVTADERVHADEYRATALQSGDQ